MKRVQKDGVNLQVILSNRLIELAFGSDLWNFDEEPIDVEAISRLGHIPLRGLMRH